MSCLTALMVCPLYKQPDKFELTTSVHCIWVSDKVLDLLPSPLPEVPAGGEVVAKGVFCDNAMEMVLEHYPKPSKDRKSKFVKDAMAELNKLGIIGMHDAGVVPSDLKLYEELSNDADWTVRVNAMIECDARNTFCPNDVKKVSTANGKFHVRSVKLFGGTCHPNLSSHDDKLT